MDDFHRRLAQIGFAAGDDLGLVLAGGYAIAQYDLTSRPSRDLLKEAIGPPAMLSVGPVLAIDDAIGLKVRALHERTTHRDFIDVQAATAAGYTRGDLERLGRRHTRFQPHGAR